MYKPEHHSQIDVTRMHDQINSRANTILWVLFAASALLFVIACSNVANLVLARTVRREPELAVRLALGASTAALRRSLLAESLVLCGSGVVAALLLAWPMVAVLGRYAARFSVRADGLTLDFNLVWFGIALALVAAVFLASDSAAARRGRAAGYGLTRRRQRPRDGRQQPTTAHFCRDADRGLVPAADGSGCADENAVHARADAPAVRLRACAGGESAGDDVWTTPQQVRDFYHEVQRRVSALPGVTHVSTGFSVPWRDDQGAEYQLHLCGAGSNAEERAGRLAREVPVGLAGIFRDAGRADCAGARLPRLGQGRRRARGDCQPEPGAEVCSQVSRR